MPRKPVQSDKVVMRAQFGVTERLFPATDHPILQDAWTQNGGSQASKMIFTTVGQKGGIYICTPFFSGYIVAVEPAISRRWQGRSGNHVSPWAAAPHVRKALGSCARWQTLRSGSGARRMFSGHPSQYVLHVPAACHRSRSPRRNLDKLGRFAKKNQFATLHGREKNMQRLQSEKLPA